MIAEDPGGDARVVVLGDSKRAFYDLATEYERLIANA